MWRPDRQRGEKYYTSVCGPCDLMIVISCPISHFKFSRLAFQGGLNARSRAIGNRESFHSSDCSKTGVTGTLLNAILAKLRYTSRINGHPGNGSLYRSYRVSFSSRCFPGATVRSCPVRFDASSHVLSQPQIDNLLAAWTGTLYRIPPPLTRCVIPAARTSRWGSRRIVPVLPDRFTLHASAAKCDLVVTRLPAQERIGNSLVIRTEQILYFRPTCFDAALARCKEPWRSWITLPSARWPACLTDYRAQTLGHQHGPARSDISRTL